MTFSSLSKICSVFLVLGILALAPRATFGQELDANVTVDRSQISGTSLGYLDNFDEQIETYINQYDWIDATFQEEEKIDLDLQIILLNVDNNYNFDAQIVVRSSRPIYNTAQETGLFLFNDEDWSFSYTPNRTLMHDELQFDQLTSLLDFYAYIILGFDFDSFSKLGGTSYYLEAQNIVSLAQTTNSSGWSRGTNRQNRAQLVADLLNTNFEKFRVALYQYHRQGLDVFLENPEKGRQQILDALRKIQEAKRNTSSNLLFDIFFKRFDVHPGTGIDRSVGTHAAVSLLI